MHHRQPTEQAYDVVHEAGQGIRSPTASTCEDTRHRPRVSKSRPNLLPSSCRTSWMRALVRPDTNQQTRRSPTPSELAGQVNPACPAYDAAGGTDERFRTHTSGCCPRLQAATIHSETRNCMRRLQTEEDLQLPHVRRADVQSHHDRV